MKRNVKSKLASLVPQEIIDILGPPPILDEQEEKKYYAMLAWFAKDIGPKDLFTWFLIKDLADNLSHLAVYRRLKSEALRYAQAQPLSKVTRPETNREMYIRIRDAQEDDPDCKPRGLATEGRIPPHFDTASGSSTLQFNLIPEFTSWADQVEKLDSLTEVTERRLITTRRELEKHLAGFGQSLRDNLRNVIEGEATEIESKELDSDEVPLSPVAPNDE